MMEAPAPMIAGPGGQQNGHGFVAGRESAAMMKDFQKTGGDISAVARTAAKNAMSYAQEFGWGDVFSTFQYKVVNERWTNNSRTLEDMNDPLEVGGDRIKRVLEAEKRMREDPSIKQAIVASEDLKVGYDRHYLYVYTRDEQNSQNISALAIEFQGKESEFQNVLLNLSQKSKDQDKKTPVLFSKPLFFQEEKTISVADVYDAAQNSFGNENRRKEMGSYLSRLSRDTSQFEQLIKKREKQEQELQAKIESMILREPKVASGFAGIAHGIIKMIDTTLSQDSRRREVKPDLGGVKEFRPIVSLEGKTKPNEWRVHDKKIEIKVLKDTILPLIKKDTQKTKPMIPEPNPLVLPAFLALIQRSREKTVDTVKSEPLKMVNINNTLDSTNKPLVQDKEVAELMVQEVVQILTPVMIGFLNEVVSNETMNKELSEIHLLIPPSEFLHEPSSTAHELFEDTFLTEAVPHEILSLFSFEPFESATTEGFSIAAEREKEVQREVVLVGFTEVLISIIADNESVFPPHEEHSKARIEARKTQNQVLKLATLLHEKISLEHHADTNQEMPIGLNRISLYAVLLKKEETPFYLKEFVSFLIQKEFEKLKETMEFAHQSGYQALFEMMQSIQFSHESSSRLEEFIGLLEKRALNQFGILIHLRPDDPDFCEKVFLILSKCFTKSKRIESQQEIADSRFVRGGDLIGYYLERMQTKHSPVHATQFFASRGIIYQFLGCEVASLVTQ